MVNKKNLLGMLVLVLVFGIMVGSCSMLAGAAVTGATQSSQNKKLNSVIQHAISEIEKVLPDNATVLIQKGTESVGYNRNALGVVTSTAGVADTAVDDITAAFIQKGIRIVDRQNTGGNVSDQEILSIGKAAGANTLVTVSVVPQGNNQRLQIRVMDIEKGVPLMQSGSGEEWKL